MKQRAFSLFFIIILLSANTAVAQRFGLTGDEESVKKQEAMQQQQMQIEQQSTQSLTGGMEGPIDPDTYLLGPGDGFSLYIFSQQPIRYQLEVGPDGYLVIPAVGKIDVRGMTLTDTEKKVNSLVRAQYKISQVNFNLNRLRLISCFVSGAVVNPGKYNIRAVDRVYDLINQAGGLTNRSYAYEVIIQSNQEDSTRVDLMSFLRTGDLQHNPRLRAGDRVVVPYADVTDQVVLVRTGFRDPGLYSLKPGQTLREFLDHYEDYVNTVDVNQATIFRQGNPEPMVINLYKNKGKFVLMAGDEIELETIRGVTVNGFVYEPGRFSYQPDFTVADYIALAGGATPSGSLKRTEVVHMDGTRESGVEIQVRRGDKIIVPESRRSVLVGDISLLQIVTSVASVVLAYIAATGV